MKSNTASRIFNVMTKWKGSTKNNSALSVWLGIFSLTSADNTRDYLLVSQHIQLLHDELDILRGKLKSRDTFPSIYEPPLKKLDNALSPALLTAQAQHVQQYLTEDVYTGLAFCSELLPAEEEAIDINEFSEIVDLINQLELMLQDSSLPTSLVVLIRRHIQLAEKAISQYPIRGATALKDAVKYAVGDLIFETEIMTNAKRENIETIGRLWTKANSIADGAIKIDGLVQLGSKAIKLLSDITGQ